MKKRYIVLGVLGGLMLIGMIAGGDDKGGASSSKNAVEVEGAPRIGTPHEVSQFLVRNRTYVTARFGQKMNDESLKDAALIARDVALRSMLPKSEGLIVEIRGNDDAGDERFWAELVFDNLDALKVARTASQAVNAADDIDFKSDPQGEEWAKKVCVGEVRTRPECAEVLSLP